MSLCIATTTAGTQCKRKARAGYLNCAQHLPPVPVGPPMNPKTGEPWTVESLLAAIAEANDVANRQATRHGYCQTWELIMRVIVKRTGLPFQGRHTHIVISDSSVDFEDEFMRQQEEATAAAAALPRPFNPIRDEVRFR